MQADLTTSTEAFERALQEMMDTIETDVRRIVLKAAFDLLCMLIEGTPRDTARCAASWSIDTHWSDWQEPPGDYAGVDLTGKAQQIVLALPDSDVICIYNNIEYLMPLEDGHSQQAPTGFIANSMAAFADLFSRAARERGYAS